MNNTSNIKEKRSYLKKLSAPLAELKSNGAIKSINEGLKAIYTAQGHSDLKTFEDWAKSGYRIRQGAKAIYIWGKQTQKTIKEDDKEKEINYFPLVALFSNSQVYKPENNK